MEKLLKIQLTGCSGVGKTTLSKWLSEELRIKFISGSYSDLVPQTRNEKHSDMITKDPKVIYQQDYQVMNLRHKQLAFEDRFITDRSYVDSIVYLINKLSVHIRQCDIESFIGNCEALLSLECTHLIFIPFSLKFLNNWDIEDNNKRILNGYYQFQISQLIYGILDMMGYRKLPLRSFLVEAEVGKIQVKGNDISVLILDELDFEKRKQIVKRFISL
jgi:hypothetical protein|nr:MAG TPA_asm: AAA domain protein [Caudoviricetes sp.]